MGAGELRARDPAVTARVAAATIIGLLVLGTTSLRGLHREDQPHAAHRAQLRFGRVAHLARIGLVQFGIGLAVLSGRRGAQAPSCIVWLVIACSGR